MESNELSIVIVTFKSENKIFTCINSIPSYINIFVVENSNDEKFKETLERKYKNVKCILTGNNKGYSVANNIGLKNVKTKFALILNPDTTLENDTIKNLISTLNSYPNTGIVAPLIYEIDEQNDNIVVMKIDVDECEEVSAQCNIECMPTFLFYQKSEIEPFEKFSGADPQKLVTIIILVLD